MEEVAGRQLLQTSHEVRRSKSGEDGSSGSKRKGLPGFSSAASARKIEEIFGREEEVDDFDNEREVVEVGQISGCEKRKKKKLKRRSLEEIYRATKPMDNERFLKKIMMISH